MALLCLAALKFAYCLQRLLWHEAHCMLVLFDFETGLSCVTLSEVYLIYFHINVYLVLHWLLNPLWQACGFWQLNYICWCLWDGHSCKWWVLFLRYIMDPPTCTGRRGVDNLAAPWPRCIRKRDCVSSFCGVAGRQDPGTVCRLLLWAFYGQPEWCADEKWRSLQDLLFFSDFALGNKVY